METTQASLTQTLYDRLGRNEGISGIVEDIVAAHMQNPLINARFLPYLQQTDTLKLLKAHTVEFLCAGSGGSEAYSGRNMLTAHKGMNISEQEFVAVLDDILGVLDKHGIDQGTRNEVLAIAYSLKDDIVRV